MKENGDIVIIEADRGNSTVVLDKADYEEKALDSLTRHPFKAIQKDPTTRNENRVNDLLRSLLKKGAINEYTQVKLRVSAKSSRTPMFYDRIKLHKPGYPL